MSVFKQHELYFSVVSALGKARAELIRLTKPRFGPRTFQDVPVYIEPSQEQLFRVVQR